MTITKDLEQELNTIKDLEHKQKTVDDLIEYISNRIDKNSNYCLFLGSGASATSNIDTGEKLVENWRKELFSQYRPNEKYSVEDAKEYFKQKHSAWYDENKEYSSLFERKFDLPVQRRKFVELAVDKAVPSFGYHYLAKLVENDYFNTIFTTNFDDLVEQVLSDNKSKRPIVCAQDSSVKSISVTSQRPKIIKLHGDFLFDDIQTTISETYSLKDNMYDKFLEFAKNFGFIFVGYSGTDKSIMDTLNTLLKREDYLNNGIYWCIRTQDKDNINENVRKLLWKDKVYYVLIDGFDEFMAEIYNKIQQKTTNLDRDNIPYNTNIDETVSEHRKYLQDQKKLFDNKYINDDIDKCLENISQKTKEINKVFESLNDENKRIGDYYKDEASFPEENDIENKIKNLKFEEAINMINIIKEREIKSSSIYNRTMQLLIECYVKTKKIQEAIETCQQLIYYNNEKKQHTNFTIYITMSMLRSNPADQIRDLEVAAEINPYNAVVQNILANAKMELYPYKYSKENILQHINKSIDLDPTSGNEAYYDKIRFFKKHVKEDKDIIKVCDDTINTLKEQNQDPFSKIFFKATIEKEFYSQKIDKIQKSTNYNFEKFKKIYNDFLTENKVFQRNLFYIKKYMNICSTIGQNDELKSLFHEFDREYYDSISYHITKSDCILDNFNDLDGAYEELTSIHDKYIEYSRESTKAFYYDKLATLLLYKEEYKQACEIIEKNFDLNDQIRDLKYIRGLYADALFYLDKNKHKNFIENKFQQSSKDLSDYIFYTYNLLKLGEYKMVDDCIKDCYKNNLYNNDDVLKINHWIAKKYLKEKIVSEEKINSIVNCQEPSLQKVAVYLLRDKKVEAKNEFEKLLKNNYSYFYEAQIMPAFYEFDFSKVRKSPLPFL